MAFLTKTADVELLERKLVLERVEGNGARAERASFVGDRILAINARRFLEEVVDSGTLVGRLWFPVHASSIPQRQPKSREIQPNINQILHSSRNPLIINELRRGGRPRGAACQLISLGFGSSVVGALMR